MGNTNPKELRRSQFLRRFKGIMRIKNDKLSVDDIEYLAGLPMFDLLISGDVKTFSEDFDAFRKGRDGIIKTWSDEKFLFLKKSLVQFRSINSDVEKMQLGVELKNRMAFFKMLGIKYISKLEMDGSILKRINACEDTISSYLNQHKSKHKEDISACARRFEKTHAKGNPRVVVLYVGDDIGYSVFANRDFALGECIGDAVGVVTIAPYPKPGENDYFYPYGDMDFRSVFIPALLKKEVIKSNEILFVDGQKNGNEMRFLNHHSSKEGQIKHIFPTGNKKGDSALLEYGFYDGKFHTLITAKRDIKKGEELLLCYGTEFEGFVSKVHYWNYETGEITELKRA
jgi:hypothetical protein